MVNIPREIIESCILPRLPVKSLIRFKCVSKSWQTLISSPDFVRIHHRHALSTDANRLIISGYIPRVPNCFHIYNFDSLDDRPSLCPYPIPHDPMPESEYAIASCEFFLLLLNDRSPKHDKLTLLNPSTRTYHEIPRQNYPNNCAHIKYGICFDEADEDCKVIMICEYSDYKYGDKKVMIMIYSFRTNSWRLIEHKLIRVVFYDISNNNDVCVVNNLLYTRLALPFKYKEGLWIGCFDIRTEQWTNDIPLPNDIDPHCCPDLRLLDGSICVTGYEKEKPEPYCVWVMKDYRWVKLIRIDWRSRGCYNYQMYYPITYRTGSRHELLFIGKFNCAVYWYDTRDEVTRYIKFNDYFLDDGCRIIQHVIKGSLVTFSKKLRCPKKDEDVRSMYRHDSRCWTRGGFLL